MAYGLLNIFKPSGPTSHDVVAAVRRGTGERRIGHAGTLDPLAEGVLVLALGKATRLIEYLTSARKEYHAEITLGITTDTYDIQGAVISRTDVASPPPPEQVKAELNHFVGAISQKPPVYSAIKVGGKPAYARARSGEEVELAPRDVTIYEIALLKYEYPVIEISVACSAGTYVRSIAHDLGQALGCGGALSKLTRTASGGFRAEEAAGWEQITEAFGDATWDKYLIPPEQGLTNMPAITVDDAEIIEISHGRAISAAGSLPDQCAAYAPDGKLVAILTSGSQTGLWYPHKVLVESQDSSKLATS